MGTIFVRACSTYSYCVIPLPSKFKVGDVAYRCDLAKKGIIEQVKIKELMYNPPEYPIAVIYVDTLNTWHTEKYLCTEAQAAENYYQWLQLQNQINEFNLRKKFPCASILP